MQHSQQQLEYFLQNNFDLEGEEEKNFNGQHRFTYRATYTAGKFQVVVWKSDDKFCLIAGVKGEKLEKVFFAEYGQTTVYEENAVDNIFLNAKLKQDLKPAKAKSRTQKI